MNGPAFEANTEKSRLDSEGKYNQHLDFTYLLYEAFSNNNRLKSI